jgi:serine/threonine protein kinase
VAVDRCASELARRLRWIGRSAQHHPGAAIDLDNDRGDLPRCFDVDSDARLGHRAIVPWHHRPVNRGAIDLEQRIGRDGRFELVRRIGEGGFGTVFEAIDRRYDCRVALKALRRDHAAAIMRFKQEFRSLADVAHPNLVRLYELFADGEVWFFTMELIEGTDFFSWVRPGGEEPPADRLASGIFVGRAPLDEERLRTALVQLARGLGALHAAGKVHRDIKPANIRVTPAGRVALLDFGLIAEAHPDDRSSFESVVGTAVYMAPEQANGSQARPACSSKRSPAASRSTARRCRCSSTSSDGSRRRRASWPPSPTI